MKVHVYLLSSFYIPAGSLGEEIRPICFYLCKAFCSPKRTVVRRLRASFGGYAWSETVLTANSLS